MTLADFLASIDADAPPAVPPPLLALWHDARGDWTAAHKCVGALSDPGAMWVHAYLHREEGDLGNARYWYRRAARPPQDGPLEDEWTAIATALLGAGAAQ